MCRNIKKLRKPAGVPTQEELQDAALQFVRKISGFRAPSMKNEMAFDQAVQDVTRAGARLFEQLKEGQKKKEVRSL